MSHAVRKVWHQFRIGLETRPAIQTSLNPARDTDISGLQYYYRGGLATAFGHRYRFDNQGVVLHYVNGRYGYVYYPTVIFNHAAALLRRHLAEPDRQEPLQEFLANMDWAVGNQDCSERYRGAWLYHMPLLNGTRAAGDLWRAGIETIKAILPRYDVGFWSRYDVRGFHIAAKSYHDLLIDNLDLLTELTGDPAFAKQSARFRGYVQNKTCYYAALGCKIIWRMARPALFA